MSVIAADVADILGLRVKAGSGFTAIDLADRIEKGLPLSALDRVCRLISPQDASLRTLIVHGETPARRLSRGESERVARLARLWRMAREVWGSDEAARQFLSEPHMLLRRRRPIELASQTEIGARMVEDILGRLQFGTAA